MSLATFLPSVLKERIAELETKNPTQRLNNSYLVKADALLNLFSILRHRQTFNDDNESSAFGSLTVILHHAARRGSDL